jgi:hypothetical protein
LRVGGKHNKEYQKKLKLRKMSESQRINKAKKNGKNDGKNKKRKKIRFLGEKKNRKKVFLQLCLQPSVFKATNIITTPPRPIKLIIVGRMI